MPVKRKSKGGDDNEEAQQKKPRGPSGATKAFSSGESELKTNINSNFWAELAENIGIVTKAIPGIEKKPPIGITGGEGESGNQVAWPYSQCIRIQTYSLLSIVGFQVTRPK